MESFISIKPKDIASHLCKNLEFMLIHQGDSKSANRRNDRGDPVHHRGEVESCRIQWPERVTPDNMSKETFKEKMDQRVICHFTQDKRYQK